jgi:hypothetical protein
MTVHDGWTADGHGVGAWLRSLAARLERALLTGVDPAVYEDRVDGTAWGVEPFPGPAAGSGHVKVLGGPRS